MIPFNEDAKKDLITERSEEDLINDPDPDPGSSEVNQIRSSILVLLPFFTMTFSPITLFLVYFRYARPRNL